LQALHTYSRDYIGVRPAIPGPSDKNLPIGIHYRLEEDIQTQVVSTEYVYLINCCRFHSIGKYSIPVRLHLINLGMFIRIAFNSSATHYFTPQFCRRESSSFDYLCINLVLISYLKVCSVILYSYLVQRRVMPLPDLCDALHLPLFDGANVLSDHPQQHRHIGSVSAKRVPAAVPPAPATGTSPMWLPLRPCCLKSDT